MTRLLLMAALLLFQNGSDPENQPPEAGKPLHCDNYLKTPKAEKCACDRAMQKCRGLPEPGADVRMDKKCRTYCRAQHCLCVGNGCSG
jgi:hypothetical protein